MLLAAMMSLLVTGSDPLAPSSETVGADADRTVRTLTNAEIAGPVPPGMVLVEGGAAKLGVPEKLMMEIGERENYEHLKHLIAMYPEYRPLDKVPDLLVDVKEVTNQQFKAFLEAHGAKASSDLLTLRWSYWKSGKQEQGLPPGQENLPISGVNYYEAQDCARWLGKRLPSEIEWEYVARREKDTDAFYLWGEGWNAWDRDACCNLYNSSRGSEGMMPALGGSFEKDVSVDGIFDLCGGVSEWTTSLFEQHPGFQPISVKKRGQRKKVKESGDFNGEHRVYRGGSYMGNEFTNNVVYRAGWYPNSAAQAIGFRCVKTATPGFDRLERAAKVDLALMSSDIKDQYDWRSLGKMAAQEIQTTDPETGLVIQSDILAYAHITRTRVSESRLLRDTVEDPAMIGIFVTSQPVMDPPLNPGAYALYFRAKGESEAQKEAKKARRSGKKDDDKEEEEKKSRSSRNKKKDEEEAEEKAGEEEKELSDEEKKAREEEAAAKKALEEAGFEQKPKDLTDLPTDTHLILINNGAGETVAWIPIDYDKAKQHSAYLTYMPNAGKVDASAAAAGRATVASESNDLAELIFSLAVGSGSNQPEITIPLEFAPGSFDKMELPADDEPSSSRRSRRGK